MKCYSKSARISAILGVVIVLSGCVQSRQNNKELESPVLDVLIDSTCNYTIEKDTVVFGAIMYEISVFKLKYVDVLDTGK